MGTFLKRVDELRRGDVIVGDRDGYTITVDGKAVPIPEVTRWGNTYPALRNMRVCPVTDSNGWVGEYEHRADHMVRVQDHD